MKNPLLFGAIFCALTLAPWDVATSPAHAQSATKPTFISKKYGFSLYLPQKPQTGTRPKPAGLGGGTIEYFATPLKPVSYSIVPITLPATAAKLSQKTYLDSVQAGILAASKGKLNLIQNAQGQRPDRARCKLFDFDAHSHFQNSGQIRGRNAHLPLRAPHASIHRARASQPTRR